VPAIAAADVKRRCHDGRLVGALILSRAVDDPTLSDEILERRQRNSDGAD